MQILDSGARRDFGTGAVRDIAEGKGRMDLMPLEAIGRCMGDDILINIGQYIYDGDTSKLWDAVVKFADTRFQDLNTAMLELSIHFEEGCKKYGDRNWEKGIPIHCFIDSGARHYFKFLRGDRDEPHDKAFLWNIVCAIWMQKNRPEMIDLPFGKIKNKKAGKRHKIGFKNIWFRKRR